MSDEKIQREKLRRERQVWVEWGLRADEIENGRPK
jgi:hypothetical protein